MGESTQRLVLPPSQGSFGLPTPSGLTPNTRSEAESAFMLNALEQTDSAAPVDASGDGLSEAQRAYHRPGGPIRASSTNYEKAMRAAHSQSSASSDLNDELKTSTSITSLSKTLSPENTTTPFPPPGQGVVPLHTGVSNGQASTVKKTTRDRGLSLSQLGRGQSFSEQDMKHLLQSNLMEPVDGAAGYESQAGKL